MSPHSTLLSQTSNKGECLLSDLSFSLDLYCHFKVTISNTISVINIAFAIIRKETLVTKLQIPHNFV